ncbi:MAG: hypothetical protein WB439_15495, partial [Acidobacteriaceae bacterium]
MLLLQCPNQLGQPRVGSQFSNAQPQPARWKGSISPQGNNAVLELQHLPTQLEYVLALFSQASTSPIAVEDRPAYREFELLHPFGYG